MHIPTDLRTAYVRRELPPRLLATLDMHVDDCQVCAQNVPSAPLAAGRWVRRGLLGRLVHVAPEPAEPVYEQELRRVA